MLNLNDISEDLQANDEGVSEFTKMQAAAVDKGSCSTFNKSNKCATTLFREAPGGRFRDVTSADNNIKC